MAPLAKYENEWVSKSGLLAAAQLEEAEKLILEMGVGDAHPERCQILAAVMQVIATNFLAMVTYQK